MNAITWHVEGLGFDVAKTTPEAYLEFIKNHKEALSKDPFYEEHLLFAENTDSATITMKDISKAWQDIGCNDFEDQVSDIIAAVIQLETGLSVECPGLTDIGEDYVLFRPKYPWEIKDAEKHLSLVALETILGCYADELDVLLKWIDIVYFD